MNLSRLWCSAVSTENLVRELNRRRAVVQSELDCLVEAQMTQLDTLRATREARSSPSSRDVSPTGGLWGAAFLPPTLPVQAEPNVTQFCTYCDKWGHLATFCPVKAAGEAEAAEEVISITLENKDVT